jgi:hypothetical protein
VIFAYVILITALGVPLPEGAQVTAETLEKYKPNTETITRAREGFAKLGFDVSEFSGLSIMISAPLERFEQVFKVKIVDDGRQGKAIAKAKGRLGYDLPLDSLDPSLRRLVSAATLATPIDFGPVSH